MSDVHNTLRDARENSWATGDNPEVQSIYLRLLRDHPALRGHNYNVAENGSTVDVLVEQYRQLWKEAAILPDVLIIQTIDNDMRCDGTDDQNHRAFGRSLDRALTMMEDGIPGVRFFLVSPWATVKSWTAWASRHATKVLDNSGTGPCDVYDEAGDPRPAGIRSLQRIVDSYLVQLERVCVRHRGCFTDGRALEERFIPEDDDLAPDLDHLSIRGHAKYARIAWAALPAEIKRAP